MSGRGARPIKILQVAARYLPDLGGTEVHVHEVSRRLGQRDDFSLTVLATDRTGRRSRHEAADGFTVLRRRAWPENSDVYFAPGVASVIRNGGWDLVHFQGIHTAVPAVGMLAAYASGLPYVVTFHTGGHSSAVRTSIRSSQWKALTPLLRGARRLVAVSNFEADLFQSLTKIEAERFTVISNGGGLPSVSRCVVPTPGRIISSGRLERYKGHHRVIEALALARRRMPDAHLRILGAGPWERELRDLAAELGVAEAVTIVSIPPDQREAMAAELTSAMVVAAMSDYEAHPVGVMEALALGVPVVGVNKAGIGDLVADGLVVGLPPQARPEEVANAILAAMDSRGKGASVALPTWDTCAEALAELYGAVVGEGPTGRGAEASRGTIWPPRVLSRRAR
ncbi:glycosyltransferase family 4 protein [Frankia sp. ACN1ag]|uniref:glycosyltransferase family 4 protein n=1 Tax=Frankia sp. ACN1ag TaxID=102891 RepID=UPI000AB6275E